VDSPEIMATLFEINMGVSHCPGIQNFIGRTCNVWAHEVLHLKLIFPGHRMPIPFSNSSFPKLLLFFLCKYLFSSLDEGLPVIRTSGHNRISV
jgi:hypothetical protein